MMKQFIGMNENWADKGNDKTWVGISLKHGTTYHYQALHQISKSYVKKIQKICDRNFPMHYIRVRDGKRKIEKKGKTNYN